MNLCSARQQAAVTVPMTRLGNSGSSTAANLQERLQQASVKEARGRHAQTRPLRTPRASRNPAAELLLAHRGNGARSTSAVAHPRADSTPRGFATVTLKRTARSPARMARLEAPETLFDHVDSAWPPMAHVRRGAERLGPEGRALVARRLADTLARFQPPAGVNAPALRRFFSFLSQVEVIAIEVPLSALPTARPEVRPLLERQLADEVFHATVFASLAKRMGGLDKPIPEAERLLDQIRRQEDPRTTAVLLNLLAEGWIENLFDHAVTWGVADDVFRIVLEDESRHVEEAHAHAEGLDVARVEEAVRGFEGELFRLVQHPRVMLPVLALAGEAKFRELSDSFLRVHKEALAEVGLDPNPAVLELEKMSEELARTAPDAQRARLVEPETMWRRTALEIWDAPRSPMTNGWIEVRVDHVKTRDLTAVTIAAIGKVWAEFPRVNRYTVGGKVYESGGVNVGVRALVGDKGEAIATLVVPDAHTRSVRDIQRILAAGVARLNSMQGYASDVRPDPGAEALGAVLRDDELMGMVPPEMVTCPVTVANTGRAGLFAGFGATPAFGQSVEIVIGRVDQRPQWRGWRYKPTATVVLGCSADHRVIDGVHSGEAMKRLEAALSPAGVKEIRARPDTLPADDAKAAEQLAGVSGQRAELLLSCKAPFWLGWLCWLFKK